MSGMIELSGVSKSYGGVPALTDISLRIERGMVHAILGENGAGKSTLMKLLAGVIAPDTGTITIDGIARRFSSPRDAGALGIVLHVPRVVAHASPDGRRQSDAR